jgi:hypothetical protein
VFPLVAVAVFAIATGRALREMAEPGASVLSLWRARPKEYAG